MLGAGSVARQQKTAKTCHWDFPQFLIVCNGNSKEQIWITNTAATTVHLCHQGGCTKQFCVPYANWWSTQERNLYNETQAGNNMVPLKHVIYMSILIQISFSSLDQAIRSNLLMPNNHHAVQQDRIRRLRRREINSGRRFCFLFGEEFIKNEYIVHCLSPRRVNQQAKWVKRHRNWAKSNQAHHCCFLWIRTILPNIFQQSVLHEPWGWQVSLASTNGAFKRQHPQAFPLVTTAREVQVLLVKKRILKETFFQGWAIQVELTMFLWFWNKVLNVLTTWYGTCPAAVNTSQSLGYSPITKTINDPLMCLTLDSQPIRPTPHCIVVLHRCPSKAIR